MRTAVLLILICTSFSLRGQITFERTYSFEGAQKIEEAPDGSFFGCATSYQSGLIYKLDRYGNLTSTFMPILRNNNVSVYDITRNPVTGGYAICGADQNYNDSGYFLLIDSLMQNTDSLFYTGGVINGPTGVKILRTGNNDFLLGVYTYEGTGSYTNRAQKITYPSTNSWSVLFQNKYFNDLTPEEPRKLLVSNFRPNTPESSGISLYDTLGNLLHSFNILDTSTICCPVLSVPATTSLPGGNYMFGITFQLAGQNQNDRTFYLAKLDSSLNIVWEKYFDWGYTIDPVAITPTSDSCIAFLLSTANGLALMKFNSSGDSLWTQFHNRPTSGRGYRFQQCADHGFVVVGSLANDAYVLKTDSLGRMLPCVSITSSGPLEICLGGSVSLSAQSGYNYLWSTGDTSVSITVNPAQTETYNVTLSDGTSACTDSVTVIINNPTNSISNITTCHSYSWNNQIYTQSGTYTYITTNSNGCDSVATLILTIQDINVTATATGSINCFGEMVEVSVLASGGSTPYVGTGLFNQTAGTVVYSVTDNNGCSGSATLTLLEPAKVEGVTSAVSTNCGGLDGSASVIPSGGDGTYTYLWSDNQTTSTASGLGTGIYSVTITDGNGCTGTASATVTGVGAQPDPAGSISGAPGICLNSCGLVFTVPPVSGATSYSWTLPQGATGSSTSNSITLCFDNTYSGGFLCVTPENTCGNGDESCVNIPIVTIRPAQPGFIAGNPNPCGPGIYTYSIPPSANASNYVWSVTGSGVSILSGQGTNSVQVSFPATFGQCVIGVYASNCIGVTSKRTTTLTGIPTHSSPLTGPGYVCPSTAGVAYSISDVIGANSSYTWFVSGDLSLTSPQGSPSSIIDFGQSFTTGTISVSTASACGIFTRNYSIRSTPFQPGSIAGPSKNLCGQVGVTYSIAAIPTATSYNWSVPSGVNMTAPNGDQSITLDFTPSFTGTGNICVSAINTCGNSVSRCFSVTAVPAPPVTPTGNGSVCKSASSELYTIPSVPGANSYLWSISGGAAIINAGTSASVNYNSASQSTAIITLNAVNSCGYSQPGKKTVAVNLGCKISNEHPISQDNSINIFPNPTRGKFYLEFDRSKKGHCMIQVLDVLGKIVFNSEINASEGSNSFEIDLSSISKGVYFTVLGTVGGEKKMTRFVVQ
ncbi:MAG: T9SS type A sorting domain-containing protein [Bacteroidetes bacterium]|nr:MAG: T9SS type A sorting domain-containing protein [Bacteroidota bacterium]